MNLKCSCGKTRFRRDIDALFALVRIQREGPREPEGQIPRRVYPCRVCGGYHLTSQDLRGRGEGETRGHGEAMAGGL